MKVRIYDLNGTKAVQIPSDIVELLHWEKREDLELRLVKRAGRKNYTVEVGANADMP